MALTEEELRAIDNGFKEIVDSSHELYDNIVALRVKLKRETKDIEKTE